MSAIILNEYGNQNRQRKYPFTDGATMKDNDGHLLPVDFIVDACLYPMDVTGPVYVASVDPVQNTIYFAGADGTVFGKAVYEQGQAGADVVELGVYERKLGVIVLGDGVSELFRGGAVRKFTASATPFTPTACVPLVQAGVRGIVLPNGDLVTGNVTFEGRNGVVVTSRSDNGSYLRFDVIGVPPPLLPDCKDSGPPICTVVVTRTPTSDFMISKYDTTTLALTLRGLSLSEICAAGKARFRKNDTDPCGGPVAPAPDLPGVSTESLVFNLCALASGVFTIVAPSSGDYINPISVRPLPPAAASVNRMTLEEGTDAPGVDAAADKFRSPGLPAGGIVIEVQGIGRNQLP